MTMLSGAVSALAAVMVVGLAQGSAHVSHSVMKRRLISNGSSIKTNNNEELAQDLLSLQRSRGQQQQNNGKRKADPSRADLQALNIFNPHRKRKLDTPCDAAFLKCLPKASCLACFEELSVDDINWAGVSPETPCSDVLQLLSANGHCTALGTDAEGKESFCDTFNNCVVWEDDDQIFDGGEASVDCTTLKKCEWEGKHENFLGDGICQMFGCYNTKVCNWDGGDCCPDTCKDKGYNECGVDGFECRDPSSSDCDNMLNSDCPPKSTEPPKPPPTCENDDKLYALNEFDSWGDGWDTTVLTLKDNKSGDVKFEGGLETGYGGRELLCLGQGCYSVSLGGGMWGNEVSWELRLSDGGPVLAHGGAPMECTFPLGGNECENTCTGKDPDGTETQLSDCIRNKCVIQLGTCTGDKDCSPCLVEDSPGYCFTNDQYNALVDCAICKCAGEEEEDDDDDKKKDDNADDNEHAGAGDEDEAIRDYCRTKGSNNNADANNSGGAVPGGSQSRPYVDRCSAHETLEGSSAVMQYAKCVDVEGEQMMIHNWNVDNFGTLDSFEWCGHTYINDPKNHGGHKALECMDILQSIVNGTSGDRDYVKSIAERVYKYPQVICDCAQEANKDSPPCDQFLRFKTLLTETLDACNALDEIDCPAWEEFAEPCKDNMMEEFGSIDFTKTEHCNFTQTGCKGVGAFPAFRRLDCGKEISKLSWDFYNDYSKGCLGDDDDKNKDGGSTTTSTSTSTTSTVPPPSKQGSSNATTAPSTTSSTAKPEEKPKEETKYVPPKEDRYEPSKSRKSYISAAKVRKVFLWMFVVGGVIGCAYVVYKKRRDSSAPFQFVRYQRQSQTEEGLGQELFGGMNSGSFEPVTLPGQQHQLQ